VSHGVLDRLGVSGLLGAEDGFEPVGLVGYAAGTTGAF